MKASKLVGKTISYRPLFTAQIQSSVVRSFQELRNLRKEKVILLNLDNGAQINAAQAYFEPSAA